MTAVDNFPNQNLIDPTQGILAPLANSEAVVPHDTNEQTFVSRAIFVGVEGNISALDARGNTVLMLNVPVGLHPFRLKRVNNTSTTATDMVFWE